MTNLVISIPGVPEIPDTVASLKDFSQPTAGMGIPLYINVTEYDLGAGFAVGFNGLSPVLEVFPNGVFIGGSSTPVITDFLGFFVGTNPAAPLNGYRWFRTDLGEEFTFINGTTVPLWNMAGTIEPFAPPEVVTASVGYAGVMYDAIVGTQHIWTLMGNGTATYSGLQTFNAGITGTGNTGTLTAGTGILGSANTWTALQTFGNYIAFGGAQLNVTSLTTGNILQYNGANWVNVSPSSVGGLIGGTQSATPFLTALGFGAAGITTVGGTPTTTGIDNTLIGYQAGYSLTTGTDVTAVGYQAARANTANFTTAFGSGALVANSTGGSNAAFGFQALTANTTGSYNAAFGFEALSSNTTGINNAAFGSQALYMNTGNYNAAFGSQALYTNTGNANAAFGSQALYANTTGVDNAAFGFQALTTNTTGSFNAAFGFEALSSNTTGINNAAFGSQTLQANTTGGSNSAFGWQALYANTTGISNSAFGWQALAGNTGDSNSAFGYSALQGNASGISNSAFGYQALNQNTAGNDNSAFGYQALFSNTNGFNSAFGNLALQFNTTGYQNSAFGFEALNSNTTGINNAAFGSALFSNTTGYQNSAFGIQAGYTSNGTHANTTGSNNIYFGYNAGPGIVTQLTYSGAIGSGAVVFDNNVVVIGSISGTNMAGATAGIATPGGLMLGYSATSGVAPVATIAGVYTIGGTPTLGSTLILNGQLFSGTAKISGGFGVYYGITTAGLGLPPIYGAGLVISLGTTSTAVSVYTPTSATGQQFRISWNLSCVTASTPTLTLTFTDPKAGAQTITLFSTAMTANTVVQGTYILTATSAAAIAIAGLDSLAAGDIFASATIEELQ